MLKTDTKRRYPAQFWLMFTGLVISSTGMTMVWPFLTVYASEKLALPMAAITSLMTINSIAGILSSFLAGSLLDRFGRKSIMVVGLFGAAAVYFGYIGAATYWHFALLLTSAGIFNPLYRVGTDAILADMIEPSQRVHAYGIFRMGRNIGVALGPILGGIALSRSYSIGFLTAALTLCLFGFISIFFLKETLVHSADKPHESLRDQLYVFRQALSDKVFVRLIGAYTLMDICGSLMWVMLAVYIKHNFGLGEQVYSWIPTTNALMVVFLQVFITRLISRYRNTQMMPIGAALYGLSMLVVAMSRSFWGFWAAMVVLTLGELIAAPTASAFVANLAPAEQRGRYLSLFALTWQAAHGIGPLGAGFLTDAINPQAPWIAGAVVGVFSVLAFLHLDRFALKEKARQIQAH